MKKQITLKEMALLIVVLLCGMTSGAKAQTNLITNPGFEDNTNTVTDAAYNPTSLLLMRITSAISTTTSTSAPVSSGVTVLDGVWYKKQSSTTSAAFLSYNRPVVAKTGTNCLMLRNGGNNSTTGVVWSNFCFQQRLSLNNTKKYTLTFWAKKIFTINTVKAFLGDKTGNTGGAVFVIDVPLNTDTTTWRKYTVNYDIPYIRTLNGALDYTTAYVGFGFDVVYSGSPSKTVTGQVVFDDISLAESTTPVITSTSSPTTILNPIPITITFNNAVTGFTSSDLSVTNGSVSNFSGSGAIYTADITPTTIGVVNVNIAAAAAIDGLSNATLAASQFSRTFITAPDAPTTAVATAGNAKASVSFSAPANNGGSAITSYTATSTPGNLTGTGSTSPITVNGLTNGTAYTFAVSATNIGGTSTASTSSASVTPHATNNNIAVSAATNISALTLTPVSDLVVSTNKLTVNSAKTVNSITVAPGAQLELTSGNTLTVTNGVTLQSDENGTATLVDNTTTNPQAISGTVQQRFVMTTARNWYLSTPIAVAAVPTGQTYYSYVEAGNNNDLSALGTAYWKPEAAGNPLNPAKGYIAPISSTSTMNFNGTFNTGVYTVNLTRTPGKLKEGYNLVANPYPSYLDWSMVDTTAAKIMSSVWYRTKTTGNAYTFDTYNGGLNVATTNGANLASKLIPPMQAFWVRVKSPETEGTLTFTNAMRKHVDNTLNKFKVGGNNTTDTKLVRLKVSNAKNSDETILCFNSNVSDSFDSYDSPKMFNNSIQIPEIYTQVGIEKLVINGLKELKTNTEIPLGFVAGEAGDFTIAATEFKNLDSDIRLILKDKQKNVEFELNENVAYHFNSEIVNATTDRFSLIFRTAGTSTEVQNPNSTHVQVYVNAANQITIIAPEKCIYTIYNAVGQLIENGILKSELQTVNCKLQTGIFVVKVNNQLARVIIK